MKIDNVSHNTREELRSQLTDWRERESKPVNTSSFVSDQLAASDQIVLKEEEEDSKRVA